MKWIWLGQEYYTCVDDEDYEKVCSVLWRYKKGYIRRSRHEDTLLHCYLLGNPLNDMDEIDHINRAKWDNRKCNLRFVTREENQRNKGIPHNAPFPTEEEKIIAKEQRQIIKQNNLNILSEKIKRRPISQEHNKHACIPVRNSNGQKFSSIKKASKQLNLNAPQISHCCKGRAKTCGGIFWEYDLD